MEKLENITYEKPNYNIIQNRINSLFQNEELLKLGLTRKFLTQTEYNYPLDYIQIGHGDNELFIVAGTHGSEIITVDFITQLLEQIHTFEEFDPNIFKLNIIPIQNPEGFDISSSNLSIIQDNNFEKSSYEYYLRYRTDSIITNALNNLNIFINNLINTPQPITSDNFLFELKQFINTNNTWKRLEDPKALQNIKIFNKLINNISKAQDFNTLKLELLNICNITLTKLNTNNLNDTFLALFINQLKNGFDSNNIWNNINNENQKKLYQQMFSNNTIKNLQSSNLEKDINKMYRLYNHPLGSQISHDATGNGINLNANHPLNPGIETTKKGIIIYGPGVKNNIKNYFPGPLGTPCQNVDEFKYAIENKALFKLINESYNNGTYLATLLYHGTGGLIYYKPYEQLMSEKQYTKIYNYNQELASIYQQSTKYNILEEASTTGYGDLLRRTFPGVLMIELSKMGGNPIGPYGDKNNIYNTINDNFDAIKKILLYFHQKIKLSKKKLIKPKEIN